MRWRKRITALEERVAALEAKPEVSVWTDVPSAPTVQMLDPVMQLVFGGFEGYVDDDAYEEAAETILSHRTGVYL